MRGGCWSVVSAGGAGEEDRDDVGGGAVETDAGAVSSGSEPRVAAPRIAPVAAPELEALRRSVASDCRGCVSCRSG